MRIRVCSAATTVGAVVAMLSVGPGCSRSPAEPDAPDGASPAAPLLALRPLTYEVPASWTVLPARASGAKKASFKVPAAGGDKHEGELAVFFHGTGAAGDPDAVVREWLARFDGDVAAQATRERFVVRGMAVEIVDAAGTYKEGLGPAVGPRKRNPVQVVKEHFRIHIAVVRTPDRGNWFLVLTGPDETVQAATGGFKAMLESVR